jgi:ABC-type branched-subunit amino acid transport system substrate-binding protein
MKHSIISIFAIILLAACGGGRAPVATVKKVPIVEPAIAAPPQDAEAMVSRGVITMNTPAVKVAILVPLSGESANIGKSMVDAASLALYDTYLNVPSDQIHAQITLMPKDVKNTPAETLAAATQAVEQGAKFVIGPLFSQSVGAIAPLLKEKNIGMLSFSNNKAVASSGVYTFGFLPEQQVERIAEYAYLNKLQRVAMLAPNDAYGEKVRDTLAELYLKNGGVVSSTELYAPSVTNIEAAVSRIAGAYNNAPADRRFQAILVEVGGFSSPVTGERRRLIAPFPEQLSQCRELISQARTRPVRAMLR